MKTKPFLTILFALLTCAGAWGQSVVLQGSSVDNIRGSGAGSVKGRIVIPPAISHYVSISGGHVSPFLTWANAATNIQAAVDVAASGDVVVVSNGMYNISAQITVTNAITIKSIDGNPTNTIIDANADVYNKRRVIDMGSINAWLIGLTVQGGYDEYFTIDGGAGVVAGSISNCIIKNNAAFGPYGGGGGARNSVLFNCLLTINVSENPGGAVKNCTLYNCTLSGNSTVNHTKGAGAAYCTMINSVSWDNQAGKLDLGITDSYSCGDGYVGTGSITNNPLFVGGGNYRLQTNSPCINTGTNQAWMSNSTDLDGNKRIWPTNGVVDMGAYEYGSSP